MCEPIDQLHTYHVNVAYKTLRKKLDNLGYSQTLPLDALPLVQKLLADLIQTTASLRHFKAIAENNIENLSQSDFYVEPYRQDNVKLIQECNQLNEELIEVKEHNLKVINDLKRKINRLESECNDLQLASSKNLKRIKDLEIESANKSKRIQELLGKCCKPTISNVGLATKRRTVFPLKKPVLEADTFSSVDANDYQNRYFVNLSKVDPHIVDIVEMADKKVNSLLHEVKKLKEQLSLKTDNLSIMKSQLIAKDREISRLKKSMENGRVHSTLSTNCNCGRNDQACSHCHSKTRGKNVSSICARLPDMNEVKILQQAKLNLEQQLRDALDKQHDAMSQAMKLAERNEELEKELKDIDHIALAVEADCNSTVKENNKKISQLQDKLERSLNQINKLENNLLVEKRMCQELRADVEAAKNEKRNIQRALDNALEENKQLLNKIKNAEVLETDLNAQINKLRSINQNERQKLARSKLVMTSLKKRLNNVRNSLKLPTVNDKENESKRTQESNVLRKKRTDSADPGRVSSIRSDEIHKKIIEKNEEIKELEKVIQHLECEKNHFRNEWNKLKDQQKNDYTDNTGLYDQISDLKHQLNEKEVQITKLRREKTEINCKKLELENRYKVHLQDTCELSKCRCHGGDFNLDGLENRTTLSRLEREKDKMRNDLEIVIQERDIAREKLRLATGAHTSEQKRLKEKIRDLEMKLDEAERQRQDILLSQGSQRTALTEIEDIKEELHVTRRKYENQRNQYTKLVALQEQTDQALNDVRNQLAQSAVEISKIMDRNRSLEQQNIQLNNQLKNLKQEINTLQSNMNRLHSNKDQLVLKLDEKTERIADLESELMLKEQQRMAIEQQLRGLHHKNTICVDQSADQERRLRDLEMEIDNYNRQLLEVTLERDNIIQENKRLQNELAALTCEIKSLQRELNDSKKESSDLKKQLQTYVGKVRYTEELLNDKEKERSEMLRHFKNLSSETTILESHKHSLQSEATEAKETLREANNRLDDLERELDHKNCLIVGYENQISELTKAIARLETDLRQQVDQKDHAESDLNGIRDLCVKLEQQKETYAIELGKKNATISHLEGELARFEAECNINQNQKSHNQATIERLQSLLEQTRLEAIEHQKNNQELRNEIDRLKQKTNKLQHELLNQSAELKRWQNQATEYSNQISRLQRAVTDEQFNRAKQNEEQRRNLSYSSKHLQLSSNTTDDLINSPPSAQRDWLRLPYNSYPQSSPQESPTSINSTYKIKRFGRFCMSIQKDTGTSGFVIPVKRSDQTTFNRKLHTESSISEINVPGYGLLYLKASFSEDDIHENIRLKIIGRRDNRVKTDANDFTRFESHQKIATMKTSNKVVGFEPDLIHKGSKNRKKYNSGLEPCGCRKNEHLPNCKIYRENNEDLLAEDTDSDGNYHYGGVPVTTTNLNITRTVHVDKIENERITPHESLDLLSSEFDGGDDEEDEVIPATPQRPRRRIAERQQTPRDRTYDLPRRNIENAIDITSQDLFSDSDEVIESSRNEVFPRHRNLRINIHDDPQKWINLANQTIVKTAKTFQELSNVIEQKFNDISQMILDSTSDFPQPKYKEIKQFHDAGIQSDTVEFVDPMPEPHSRVRRPRTKYAGTATELELIEQQISATSISTNLQKNKKVTRNVTITKKIHEKTSSPNVGQHKRTVERYVEATPKKDEVLYNAINFQSIRDAKGNSMMITAQTHRANDGQMSNVRKCNYEKCEGCHLPRVPSTTQTPMLPLSSSPITPSLRHTTGPENITTVLSKDVRVTPSSSTAAAATSLSQRAPASSSFHNEPIYDVPRPVYDLNVSHIPVSRITGDTTQGIREKRHHQSESHDQHSEVQPTGHSYNLRPLPGRIGQHASSQRQTSQDHHQSSMKKKGKRQ